MKITARLEVNIDQEFSRLNKDATAAKQRGDLREAVRLLRTAKQRRGLMYAETRLAKFLQQAGLFDEAIEEIEWLIEHSNHWAETLFGHQPRIVRRCQQAGWIERIHRDAALICKREKRVDLEAFHQEKTQHWLKIHKSLNLLSRIEKAKRTQI
jgi:tetratricopeptide (TPR) repeat protein